MPAYFILVFFYPLISTIILKILGEDGNTVTQILNEYFLWLGIFFLYGAILVLLFFGRHGHPLSAFWSFLLFTIVYFSISVARKTIWTESSESSIVSTPEPPS